MEKIFFAVVEWLHITATVMWIGGIAFILFIAVPSAKKVLSDAYAKLIGEISKRFTILANICIILLIITGIVLTILNKIFLNNKIQDTVNVALILKHIAVMIMILIHFYRGLILSKKILKTDLAEKKITLQKFSYNLVKVNFIFGIIVLLLSEL